MFRMASFEFVMMQKAVFDQPDNWGIHQQYQRCFVSMAVLGLGQR